MARVLICDDAVFMRMTIREALENAGHEVVAEAEKPSEAIDLYLKHKPDIVTMDLLMEEPGITAIEDIIGIDPDAKIVVVSVLSEQEGEVVEAIRKGASGIVTKPVNRDILISEINRLLTKK